MEAVDEDALVRTVGLHRADLEVAACLPCVGDEVAFGRPDRRRIAAVAVGDTLRAAATGAHHVDLRLPAAIRLEHNSTPIRRVGRRGVDRRARGQLHRLAAIYPGRVDVGDAAVRHRERDGRAVRREMWRERHRRIVDELSRFAAELGDIDLRIALLVAGEGQHRIVAAESRRQRQRRARTQHLHIGAVLIHDRQLLLAVGLGAALGDEHHLRVEIAALAGKRGIDRVRDDVRDAPIALRIGVRRIAGHLLRRLRVPYPHRRRNLPAALDLAHHQRIDIDGAPVGKGRRVVDVAHLRRQRRRVERCEQPRAREVGAHDIGDLLAEARIGRGEIRNGDRQRHEIAA